MSVKSNLIKYCVDSLFLGYHQLSYFINYKFNRGEYYPLTVLTTSSILRMDTTVSDAKVIADVDTRSG